MSDHADTIREYIHRCGTGTFVQETAALESIDALIAERDEARRERDKALLSVEGLSKRLAIAVAAEAEVARLREALAEIVSYIDKGDVSIETIDQIALAALAKEDTA